MIPIEPALDVLNAYSPGHEHGDVSFGPVASGLINQEMQKALGRLLQAVSRAAATQIAQNDETPCTGLPGALESIS
jgi:hypothetical protein